MPSKVLRASTLFAGLVGSSIATKGLAQRPDAVLSATFAPPGEAMHAERYHWPADWCIARLWHISIQATRGQRVDTIPDNPRNSSPAVVVEHARKCLDLLPAATVPVYRAPVVRALALLAGDEAAYKTMLAREFSSMPVRERNPNLTFALQAVMQARPLRWSLLEYIAEHTPELVGGDPADQAMSQVQMYGQVVSLASYTWGDLTRYDSLAARLHALESKRMSAITNPTAVDSLQHKLTVFGEKRAALQAVSQRHTSEAVLALSDTIYQLGALGGVPDAKRFWNGSAVGVAVPAIPGGFQFPRAGAPLAQPGHVTMIVYVDAAFQRPSVYATLRRIQHQYPDLHVTLVTRIQGTVRSRAPSSQADQARQLKEYFIDSLRIGKSLVVDTSSFTTLPGPDPRRVYELSTVEKLLLRSIPDSLTTGRTNSANFLAGTAVLVNQNGIVVRQDPFINELFWSGYIGRLLAERDKRNAIQ